ncbi:MAG: monovalent cation/H+ antiporter subunit D family protein [Deltaproteobacteria bacterium]|nr:monovalent cation/H+ antiporter subunit D family protein [Deltaproteobacteria bacterium]MBW2332428.1 monovalent cation/H+ antiporter subunit D family protein [Deltaproteobacteria bacterium]RLB25682.1 MAG: monovalent cation/H+ antiporter subunit D family protein [Deltaproteobacteria bacterium]
MLQAPVLIVVIPLMFTFVALIFGLWKKGLCYPIVLIALSLSFLATLQTLNIVITSGIIHYRLGNWNPPWGIEYVVDYLNAFVLPVISFVAIMVAIYSKKSVEKELSDKVVYFYCIFLLQVTGFLGITVTGDMFNLYVFLEIASLAGYALITMGEDGAPFASFNYLIFGTIGACFYLLGVGYLYAATGSLNMADLARLLPDLYGSKVILVGFSFFMVGLAIKMALFPLHVWLPDAYTYAPSSVSALLAPLMTKVGAYVLIRVIYTVFKPYFSIEILPAATILCWIAAAAIIFGAAMALAQTDLKRMLTYILVSEVGYLALGVGLGNRNGLTGAILHILNDAFMMLALFMVVGAIMYRHGGRRISELRYLHKKMPFTMAVFVVAALSVIGIPPTCGFFSKWYLILGAINAHGWIFVAVLLASSLLNAILFFRVIENIYLEPHDGDIVENHDMVAGAEESPLTMLVPILIAGAGILSLGVLSGKIISTIIQFAIPAGF